MPDAVLGLLGLARRAGRLSPGFDAALKAAEDGHALLVLAACDTSERTMRAIESGCARTDTELVSTGYTMEQLGNSIGRNDTAIVAVCDKSLAKRVKELCHA
ncbi:MAG: ribosomal L7Ae/L30e/S12e/Gadd45 family protein [Clostridia bacterium]|nr:ribosomal L7Ae/L30e/S12e/Gadd45 family protein [Clostridia bacterium]